MPARSSVRRLCDSHDLSRPRTDQLEAAAITCRSCMAIYNLASNRKAGVPMDLERHPVLITFSSIDSQEWLRILSVPQLDLHWEPVHIEVARDWSLRHGGYRLSATLRRT